MEEDANTLKKHFAIVDDFFKKTFREECKLFIGLKTTQRADTSKVSIFSAHDEDKVKGDRLTSVLKESTSTRVLPPSPVLTHAKGPVLVALPVDKKNGRENTLAGGSSNFFAVSPRLQYFTSGETLGKLKLICGLTIPRMCHLEQDVALSSNGMIRGQMKVSDLMEGLKINGRIGLNTITSAAEDASSLGFSYLRSDMFSSVLYQRNGLGSSNVAVDFGSKFLNLLAGAGFERSKLSFVEAESGVEEIKAMYVGGGFTGLNWSIGAKCTHANGAWSNGRVAVMQKLRPSTTAVCSYDLDMAKSFAIISLGFSQGMVLRLPHFLSPTNSSSRWYSGAPTFSGTPAGVSSSSSINGASRSDSENEYSRASGNALPLVFPLISHVPLVFALKGESTGKVSATIRTIFNNSIRCGLVAHYNVLWKNSKPRLGVIISLEQEAS